MKTIHVSYHRDGDRLVIGEQPWPVRLIEAVFGAMPDWLVAGRIPFGWRVWNAVLIWCDKFDRPLLELPVAHGCDAADALWSDRHRLCWHGSGWSGHDDKDAKP